MALDARRFAHLARDDHGLARYRSTAGQLPSHISVTRVLLREAHERIVKNKCNDSTRTGPVAPAAWRMLHVSRRESLDLTC
jgi:hypothetical protein